MWVAFFCLSSLNTYYFYSGYKLFKNKLRVYIVMDGCMLHYLTRIEIDTSGHIYLFLYNLVMGCVGAWCCTNYVPTFK